MTSHRWLSNTHYATYSCVTSNVKDDDKYSVTVTIHLAWRLKFLHFATLFCDTWQHLVSLRSRRNWWPLRNVWHRTRSRTSTKHMYHVHAPLLVIFYVKLLQYKDGIVTLLWRILPNLNAIVITCKDMQAKNGAPTKFAGSGLECLATEVDQYNGCKTVGEPKLKLLHTYYRKKTYIYVK